MQQELWQALLHTVERGAARATRLELLARVLRETTDPVGIEHAYRMVRGDLKLAQIRAYYTGESLPQTASSEATQVTQVAASTAEFKPCPFCSAWAWLVRVYRRLFK